MYNVNYAVMKVIKIGIDLYRMFMTDSSLFCVWFRN
jgi:hypothetical protein